MYRNDDEARDQRATVLIDEIAELERARIAHAAAERRLEDARCELATLQLAPGPTTGPTPEPAGITTHIIVFCVAAFATFAGYTLLF
jgi:hypothetical protein